MDINFWDILAPTLTAAGASFVSWFSTRRKYESELAEMHAQLEGSQVDNLNKAMQSYDVLMERYASQIEHLVAENKRLREERTGSEDKIDEILAENRHLRKEIEALKEQVSTLTALIEKNKPTDVEHLKLD